MQHIPKSLTVTNTWYCLDGGSITLEVTDEEDQSEHVVDLPQHQLPVAEIDPLAPPGALVFDSVVLDVRGPDEAALVRALRDARISPRRRSPSDDVVQSESRVILGDDIKEYFDSVDKGPFEAIGLLIKRVIDFVESEEYVQVARRHGRVA